MLEAPSSSNDNSGKALIESGFAIGVTRPVSFEGSWIHYLPAIVVSVLAVSAIALGAQLWGIDGLWERQVIRLVGMGGVVAILLLALAGFLRKRTVGVYLVSGSVRLAVGFPDLRLHEIAAADIVGVKNLRGIVGQVFQSGTVRVVTKDGDVFTARGIQNSAGAETLIALQKAAASARNDHNRLRLLEAERWVGATTPRDLKLADVARDEEIAANSKSNSR